MFHHLERLCQCGILCSTDGGHVQLDKSEGFSMVALATLNYWLC